AVLEPSVASLAVSVFEPAVGMLTVKVCVPEGRLLFAGGAKFASEELIAIESLGAPATRFQLASTALTVTLKEVPAVRAEGLPVLPVALPGSAVSPGISSCSFAKVPALTVVDGLVLAVLVPSLASVAVTVLAAAVLRVTVKVC